MFLHEHLTADWLILVDTRFPIKTCAEIRRQRALGSRALGAFLNKAAVITVCSRQRQPVSLLRSGVLRGGQGNKRREHLVGKTGSVIEQSGNLQTGEPAEPMVQLKGVELQLVWVWGLSSQRRWWYEFQSKGQSSLPLHFILSRRSVDYMMLIHAGKIDLFQSPTL